MSDIALVMPKSTFLELPMVMQPLGLFYIATRLKYFGYDADFYDLNVDEFPEDNYEQIWVSATSPQMKEVRKIGKILQDYKAKTVLGGPAVWANPFVSNELEYDLFVDGEADSPRQMDMILNTVILNTDSGVVRTSIEKDLEWVLPPTRSTSTGFEASSTR